MTLTTDEFAKLAVLIVSYGNPFDVNRCLESLARSTLADFEVFICENAGREAFGRLEALLTEQTSTLEKVEPQSNTLDAPGGRLTVVSKCRLRGRAIIVRLAVAKENLGYAGGINAWLERLLRRPGWEAVFILNPDTEVGDLCLSELMAKAAEGFGMVGGTLVFDDLPDRVINYGLIWSRLTGRTIAAGRNCLAGSTPPPELLARIDAVSGASVLVTRAFIEDVGLMSEDYFLYMEDVDWGRRRGHHRIGFARKAIIRHVCGTSIGSAVERKGRSPLSIYLNARNGILYSRRCAGWWWVFHFVVGLSDALRYLLDGSPRATKVALYGLMDGIRGKSGRPNILALTWRNQVRSAPPLMC